MADKMKPPMQSAENSPDDLSMLGVAPPEPTPIAETAMSPTPDAPPEVHEAMRDYSDKAALNRASMISLNPSSPDYVDQLAAHQAKGDLLKNDHLHNISKMMPSYGGPGAAPAPGQMIPPSQLPQDEFKYKMGQANDKIAASEGDPLDWATSRAEKARLEKDNPWGSPGNHPGIMGKIGHVLGTIGNTVGNAELGPNVMSSIPGSQANLNAKIGAGAAEENRATANNEKEAQTEAEKELVPERQAATEHTEQETADLKNPPAKSLQDQLAARVAQDQKDGKDPATDTLANQIQDQITSLQRQPNQQELNLDKQYNDAVAKGDHEGAKRILGEMHDIAVAKQAPQRPPQTMVVLPGGKTEIAKPGETLPEGTQNIGGFASMGRPTTQERNVGAQAQMAAAGIPSVVAEIDKLKDQLGPVAGRWNEFMQGRVGMENPEMAGLRADLLMVASAVALAHARGRLPENLRQEFDHAINAPKQDPENLKATLNHILPWMQRMGQMGENQNGGGGNTPAAPTKKWNAIKGVYE